jgi:hypothetical protein
VLTSYHHSIIDAIILSLSSSCRCFEPGLFREGIFFKQGSLLLLASVSQSLLLFRIADWRSHQEGIKCAFLQESSLFLLVSASVLLTSVSNSLLLFLRRLALATKSTPRAVQASAAYSIAARIAARIAASIAATPPLPPLPSQPASQPPSPPEPASAAFSIAL